MDTTILNIICEFLSNDANEDRHFNFQEIFERVELAFADEWSKNNSSLSKSQMNAAKMGEVYKLLTIDGRFVRHDDGTWSKRKINETS